MIKNIDNILAQNIETGFFHFVRLKFSLCKYVVDF